MGVCSGSEEAAAAASGERFNTLMAQPEAPKCKVAVVQFKVPGAKNGGTDKGPDGNRIDSIPIANGCIKAGASCEMLLYNAEDHDGFLKSIDGNYDAFIVRINPGQLSQGTPEGTQEKFDAMMRAQVKKGNLVWSSPDVQTKMGAKDALVKIANLKCGLTDTLAYYDEKALRDGFFKTMAFQPRVLKQNRGSAGEGIWLCWLWDKAADKQADYPSKNYGDASLKGDECLKLMEMNDNHVEYHTAEEFMQFCVKGQGDGKTAAGVWTSTFDGKYLEGGEDGQLVDQRLLPRISEGEVRCLMVGDQCQMIIHKKPEGGLSAVGGNSAYTYYKPDDKKYADLLGKLMADIPDLLKVMNLEGEPLPLLWTADYIPKDPEHPDEKGLNENGADTEYVVGEFNCSCVGVSKFQAVCGGEQTLADVSDADYFEACELTDLMGTQAVKMIADARAK